MKKTTLYISLFFLLSSFVQKPNISFEVNEHNFGDVKENDGKVSYKFMFTNNGQNALRVLFKIIK